jgi:hypothetical protein
MTEDKQGIQGVYPNVCPHCGKEILISFLIAQPKINGIFTQAEAAKAKTRLMELLETITFKSPEEKKLVQDWLSDEHTIFGMGDVESLLKTISINQITNKDGEEKVQS